MFGQHPKLKLQNMGVGEPRAGDTRPCQNTTMRALWRTASTSQFFVCKVWIFRSFNGEFFFCFLCLCFLKGSWSSREGGVLLLFQRGGLKNNFARRGGGVFYQIPPSLLYFTLLYPPPPLRERIRYSDLRGTGFLNL
jgi:hypothetical protein